MSTMIPKPVLIDLYMRAAIEMEENGVQPTGRRLIAVVRGGKPQDYPQGISGNDRIAYDTAMIALGYVKNQDTKFMWRKYVPTLDEVRCEDLQWCKLEPPHTLADHASQP